MFNFKMPPSDNEIAPIYNHIYEKMLQQQFGHYIINQIPPWYTVATNKKIKIYVFNILHIFCLRLIC